MTFEEIHDRVSELVQEAREAMGTGSLKTWKLDLEETAGLRIHLAALDNDDLERSEGGLISYRLSLLEEAFNNIREIGF